VAETIQRETDVHLRQLAKQQNKVRTYLTFLTPAAKKQPKTRQKESFLVVSWLFFVLIYRPWAKGHLRKRRRKRRTYLAIIYLFLRVF
jgi:hypothetical protein